MVKKKSGSHRQSLKQKYKVQKRCKEHERKLKKAARRGGQPPGKKKRDPGIPNSWPLKKELLEQVERAKAKKESDRLERKEQKKLAKAAAKAGGLEGLAASAKNRGAAFEAGAEAAAARGASDLGDAARRSARAYARELAKVVEAADVILEVLDARDPVGSRSSRVENAVARAPGKRLVLVLNKVDLVPRDVATGWLDALRRTGLAVVAFKAVTQKGGGVGVSPVDLAKDAAIVAAEGGRAPALGVDALLQLLKNYARDGGGGARPGALVAGVVGFPNAGKSSVIKSLVGARQGANHGARGEKGAATVSATPGFTKALKEVRLDSKLTLIDSPGVVGVGLGEADAASSDAMASLLARGCVDPAELADARGAASALIQRADPAALAMRYALPVHADPERFLAAVARKRGRLRRGGLPDLAAAAVDVLRDFARGDVRFFVAPPAKPAASTESVIVPALAARDFDPNDAAVLAVADKPTSDAAGMDRVALRVDSDLAPRAEASSDDDDDAMDEDEAPRLVPDEAFDFATDYQYAGK